MLLALALSAGISYAADTAPEVSIQTFSDFQCPYCKMFAPAAREGREQRHRQQRCLLQAVAYLLIRDQ
jgi:hypothetical protein